MKLKFLMSIQVLVEMRCVGTAQYESVLIKMRYRFQSAGYR